MALVEFIKYKKVFIEMPQAIIEYNKKEKIINDKQTSELVQFRQQHPVLHKMDINVTKGSIINALNKLTEQNIVSVSEDIQKIENINTEQNIEILIDVIIKRSMTEQHFIKQYVDVCCSFQNNIKLMKPLTNKCKILFDNFINQSTNIEDKYMLINLMKLIGYLYNNKVLDSTSIDYCFHKTLDNESLLATNKYFIEMASTLHNIVKTTYMNVYLMQRLPIILNNKLICKRDQFMIQDMIEHITKK